MVTRSSHVSAAIYNYISNHVSITKQLMVASTLKLHGTKFKVGGNFHGEVHSTF